MAESHPSEIEPEDSDSDLEYSDAIEQDLSSLDLTKDEFGDSKKKTIFDGKEDSKKKDEEMFFDGKEDLEDEAEKVEAEEKEDPLKERKESEDKLTDEERDVPTFNFHNL